MFEVKRAFVTSSGKANNRKVRSSTRLWSLSHLGTETLKNHNRHVPSQHKILRLQISSSRYFAVLNNGWPFELCPLEMDHF